MGFSSGRACKGKAPAELPSLLQQHLPKRARTLVSPLSDDDREVLSYMLAFGLHLQMLAGVVLPSESLQPQKYAPSSSSPSSLSSSSFSPKVGSVLELRFPSLSLPLLSSKPRTRPGKASPPVPHKASCCCGCFSCYSSFWSRWAASPNRDLLSAIIEMAEVAGDKEDRKRQRGKDSAKKQAKEHTPSKGKKLNVEKCKPQGSQNGANCSTNLLPSELTMDDGASESLGSAGLLMSTLMDGCKSTLLNDVCADNAQVVMPRVSTECSFMEVEVKSLSAAHVIDVAGVVAASTKSLPILASSSPKASSMATSEQAQRYAQLEIDAVDFCPMQEVASGDISCGNCNSKPQGFSKRKSNQIIPLDAEGAFVGKAGNEDLNHVHESCEGCSSPPPNLVESGNTTDNGVLSRILPHTLCDIVSRIWELVSLGSWSHIESY